MHAVPPFSSRRGRLETRRGALLYALAATCLAWGAPSDAHAQWEEALAPRTIRHTGRPTAHVGSPGKSKPVARMLEVLPGRVRVLSMKVSSINAGRGASGVAEVGGLGTRAATKTTPSAEPKGRREGRSGDKKTVLIVEDEPSTQVLAEHCLGLLGHPTVVAAPGEVSTAVVLTEGLRLINEREDIGGVVIDGLEGDWVKVAAAAETKSLRFCVVSGAGKALENDVTARGGRFFGKPTPLAAWQAVSAFLGGEGQGSEEGGPR